MNGRYPYTSPSTTAPVLNSIGKGELINPLRSSAVLTKPLSRSRNIHA